MKGGTLGTRSGLALPMDRFPFALPPCPTNPMNDVTYFTPSTSSASAASGYDPGGLAIQAEDWILQKFHRLASQWKEERGPLSSARQMAEHPTYQEIIKMGRSAIPFLLAELEREPDHWFLALHTITGANPVSETNRGRVREMAQDWISWGRERGYSWDNISAGQKGGSPMNNVRPTRKLRFGGHSGFTSHWIEGNRDAMVPSRWRHSGTVPQEVAGSVLVEKMAQQLVTAVELLEEVAGSQSCPTGEHIRTFLHSVYVAEPAPTDPVDLEALVRTVAANAGMEPATLIAALKAIAEQLPEAGQ